MGYVPLLLKPIIRKPWKGLHGSWRQKGERECEVMNSLHFAENQEDRRSHSAAWIWYLFNSSHITVHLRHSSINNLQNSPQEVKLSPLQSDIISLDYSTPGLLLIGWFWQKFNTKNPRRHFTTEQKRPKRKGKSSILSAGNPCKQQYISVQAGSLSREKMRAQCLEGRYHKIWPWNQYIKLSNWYNTILNTDNKIAPYTVYVKLRHWMTQT